RKRSNENLLELIREKIPVIWPEDKALAAIELVKERAVFIQDLIPGLKSILDRPETYDQEAVKKRWKAEQVQPLLDWMKSQQDFTSESLHDSLQEWMKSRELGPGMVLPVLRI